MATLTVSRTIAAPPEKVFDGFTDFERAAERIRGIQKLEILERSDSGPGGIGVGMRFRETRVMFGKEATEEMEITRFERPTGYTVEARSHGSHYVSTFAFVADGPGTRVDVTFDARPESFFAKLMSPFMFLFRGTMRRCLEGDIEDLQKHIESGTGSSKRADSEREGKRSR